MLRNVSSVQALSFGFGVCCTVVTIQALDSLQLCQASLILKVVSSGFSTILDAQPYAPFAIGFLTDPFNKPLFGLGGGQRRQILQIFIFSDLFGTKSTNTDFFGMKLTKINNKFHHIEKYINVLKSKDQTTSIVC